MGLLSSGQVLQERYRVDRLLGEGGMSWVYRAHHLLLEQPVALKVIKPLGGGEAEQREHAEQLCVEAGLIARLDHPNLVRAFDLFMFEGVPVLVLEMVDGRDLEQVVQLAPRPISERRVLVWGAAILDALEYLHAQNPPIIVRDLKPKNIMLDRGGRIRVIDFGLAKESSSGTRAFVRGMGSEGYAPLEQYAHKSTDARSDLYGLGATLYFLLTRTPPPAASCRLADNTPVEDPREINPTVSARTWRALQRLLALRADDRPSNAAEARELLYGEEEEAPPTPGRRCPQCRLLLQPRERMGVEIDCCVECGGIWLDRGELGRLVGLGQKRAATAPEPSGSRQAETDDLSGPLGRRRRRRKPHDSDELERRRKSERRGPTYLVWKLLKELFD